MGTTPLGLRPRGSAFAPRRKKRGEGGGNRNSVACSQGDAASSTNRRGVARNEAGPLTLFTTSHASAPALVTKSEYKQSVTRSSSFLKGSQNVHAAFCRVLLHDQICQGCPSAFTRLEDANL
jgi:hypothetical protein